MVSELLEPRKIPMDIIVKTPEATLSFDYELSDIPDPDTAKIELRFDEYEQ